MASIKNPAETDTIMIVHEYIRSEEAKRNIQLLHSYLKSKESIGLFRIENYLPVTPRQSTYTLIKVSEKMWEKVLKPEIEKYAYVMYYGRNFFSTVDITVSGRDHRLPLMA